MSKRLASDRPGEEYTVTMHIPAAAAGNDIRTSVLVAPFDLEVMAVELMADVAMTGVGTNFMTLTLHDGGTAGAGTGVIAQFVMDATSDIVLALDNTALPLSATAADLLVDEGDILVFDKSEDATGDAFTVSTLQVTFKAQ